MIVSRSQRLVFVHPWKTGGTSVAAALETALGIEKPSALARTAAAIRRKANSLLGRPALGKHAFAVDIRASMGAGAYGDCFSFGFVRNPWDWLVSWYTFVRETKTSPDSHREWRHHLFHEVRDLDFAQFVGWVEAGGLERAGARQRSSFAGRSPVLQRDWLADHRGQLIVNFVGRFESLATDFQVVAKHLGRVDLQLPHVNKSKHDQYRSYYTADTRERVGRYFRADIETFGYEF